MVNSWRVCIVFLSDNNSRSTWVKNFIHIENAKDWIDNVLENVSLGKENIESIELDTQELYDEEIKDCEDYE